MTFYYFVSYTLTLANNSNQPGNFQIRRNKEITDVGDIRDIESSLAETDRRIPKRVTVNNFQLLRVED